MLYPATDVPCAAGPCDIARVPGASPAACMATCNATADCTSFAFYANSSCVLKSYAGPGAQGLGDFYVRVLDDVRWEWRGTYNDAEVSGPRPRIKRRSLGRSHALAIVLLAPACHRPGPCPLAGARALHCSLAGTSSPSVPPLARPPSPPLAPPPSPPLAPPPIPPLTPPTSLPLAPPSSPPLTHPSLAAARAPLLCTAQPICYSGPGQTNPGRCPEYVNSWWPNATANGAKIFPYVRPLAAYTRALPTLALSHARAP